MPVLKDDAVETTAVTVLHEDRGMVRAEDFMPLLTVQQAVQRKGMINDFISGVMRESEDYGRIPGAGEKKVLLKPGAEKLCSIFGLAPSYLKEVIIEDWTGVEHGGEPLFSYEYRCRLTRGDRVMGEAIGSANSWESKYRYRWVSEDAARGRPDFGKLPTRSGTITEFAFSVDKAETSGPYGKPAEYWQRWRDAIASGEARRIRKTTSKGKELDAWEMGGIQYRVPNPDIADVINTIQKMAQKRALVAAVLVVTNCSDAFTQDLEDFEPVEPPAHRRAESDEAVPPIDKPQGLPSGRPVPEALKGMFENLDRNPAHFKEATEILQAELVKRGGKAGSDRYGELVEAFRKIYPRGSTTPMGAYKDFLLDLWAAIDALPEKQPEVV